MFFIFKLHIPMRPAWLTIRRKRKFWEMPLRVQSRKELRFIIWYQVGRLIHFGWLLRQKLLKPLTKCLNLYEQSQTQSLTRLWRYLRVDHSTTPCSVSDSMGRTVSHQIPKKILLFRLDPCSTRFMTTATQLRRKYPANAEKSSSRWVTVAPGESWNVAA